MDKARKNKDVSATKAEEQPVATTATTAPQEAKRRPVQTFRADDVSASIWVREHLVRGQVTKFWSVTLERSYKDAAGQWRYTKTYDSDSLGKIVSLCQQASEYIGRQQEAAK
jgi:hypothetical protein